MTVTDSDGFPLNVVFNQKSKNVESSDPEKVVLSYTGEKRRRREFNRFESGPAAAHKVLLFLSREPKQVS